MNRVILVGNLTRDPETRTTNSGATCCQFGLAVQRKFKNASGGHDVDFFNVTAWRQLGDLCQQYLAKGRKCLIDGSIQIRTYDAQDGSKRTAVEIIAENVEFLTPRNGDGAAPASRTAPPPTSPVPPAFTAENGFTQVDNDELPF